MTTATTTGNPIVAHDVNITITARCGHPRVVRERSATGFTALGVERITASLRRKEGTGYCGVACKRQADAAWRQQMLAKGAVPIAI